MTNKVRIQDDLYEYVNGEWLQTAVIPDDRPTTGGFADLDQAVEELLMNDFRAMSAGEKEIPSLTGMADAVRFYQKVLNVEKRNAEGIQPLLPVLAKIQSISSLKEWNERAVELWMAGVDLPLNIGVQTDMKDALHHAFVIQGPDIILPDTTYYSPDNEAGKRLLEVYETMAAKLLAFTPLSAQQQKQYIEDTLAFDALVAQKVKSQVEWADYVKDYNPMPLAEVISCVAPFDMKGFLSGLYGAKIPSVLIARDPKAIREFAEYFNEKTFAQYLHWAYVKLVLAAASSLSEEMAQIATTYRRALTGVEKDPSLEKQAYRRASQFFSDPIGVYYGRTYFGEEAKADVVSMVKKIIEVYKTRVQKNTFLEEATKEKALLKLSKITIKMGYPDDIHEYYTAMKVNEEDSLYEADSKLSLILMKRNLHKLYQDVDRSEWWMPGHMVNACYDPSSNDITFPAAILQKPFYSIHQSVAENLGGIGAVIGHEISHAFDNNGAHFDENGNLENWWSENDFAEFEKLTKGMIAEFDGIPFHGGEVNGELVVSENIADNGGLAVTLEIMHQTKDADFKEYFENWARVWCRKAKEEYLLLLLSNDVHAPGELRVNMQPRNFPEWYDTFGVTPEDKMYLPEEKRVVIW